MVVLMSMMMVVVIGVRLPFMMVVMETILAGVVLMIANTRVTGLGTLPLPHPLPRGQAHDGKSRE
jgi:hypothetical protein